MTAPRLVATDLDGTLLDSGGRVSARTRAVLDERLRVRGIKGLRVIDASVMPAITSGNTAAPTVMIGEKGAQMIREDAR